MSTERRAGLSSFLQALRQDPPPTPEEPLPDWVQEETEHWDHVERLTWRVARWAVAFFPVWFVLLALFGAVGGARLALFSLATIAAVVIAWVIERRWTARREGRAAGARRGPRRIGPGAAAAIGAGCVLLLVYVIWVVSAS